MKKKLAVILLVALFAGQGAALGLGDIKYQIDTKILGQGTAEEGENLQVELRDIGISKNQLPLFSTVQDDNIYPGDSVEICGDIYIESDPDIGYHYQSFYVVSGGGFSVDSEDTIRVETNTETQVCLDFDAPDTTGSYEAAIWIDELSDSRQLGAKDSFSVEEEPPEPANADIDVSKTNVEPKELINFDGSGSTGDGSLEYYWYKDSDDNMVSRGTSYSTSFVEPGTHTVYLEVIGVGRGDLASVNINVEVNKPEAGFTVSNDNVTLGRSITLDASQTTSGTYQVDSYQWRVDGEKLEGRSVTFTPTSEGRKNIQLTVTDAQGNKDSVSKTVNVYDPTDPNPGIIERISQVIQNLFPF